MTAQTITIDYVQGSDINDEDSLQNIRIRLENCDTRNTIMQDESYFIISTERWAFQDPKELLQLVEDFIKKTKP